MPFEQDTSYTILAPTTIITNITHSIINALVIAQPIIYFITYIYKGFQIIQFE